MACAPWFSDACFHSDKRQSRHLVCEEGGVLVYLTKAEKFSPCPFNKSSKIGFLVSLPHIRGMNN